MTQNEQVQELGNIPAHPVFSPMAPERGGGEKATVRNAHTSLPLSVRKLNHHYHLFPLCDMSPSVVKV